jgi:hypothetical protein
LCPGAGVSVGGRSGRATRAAAERAAKRLGLPLEVRVVGDAALERQLERLSGAALA